MCSRCCVYEDRSDRTQENGRDEALPVTDENEMEDFKTIPSENFLREVSQGGASAASGTSRGFQRQQSPFNRSNAGSDAGSNAGDDVPRTRSMASVASRTSWFGAAVSFFGEGNTESGGSSHRHTGVGAFSSHLATMLQYEEQDVPIEPIPSEQENPTPFHVLNVIRKGIKNWLWSFNNVDDKDAGPTPSEIARGIRLQRVYDFFDPSSIKNRIRMRRIYEDKHFHRRIKVEEEDDDEEDDEIVIDSTYVRPCDQSEEDDEPPSGSRVTVAKKPSPSPRTSFMEGSHPSASSSESGLQKRKTMKGGVGVFEGAGRQSTFVQISTMTDHVILTRWAVVVGKLSHQRIVNFKAVTGEAATKMRLEMAKQDKGTFVVGSVIRRAEKVCRQAKLLADQLGEMLGSDVLDAEWEHDGLLELLFGVEYTDTLLILGKAAEKTLSVQPALAEATVPCKVFGDTHGQLRDVLLYFYAFGMPRPKGESFVFNGDFVDRGAHQVEIAGLLLALKIAHPDKVWLVRGNHEDRVMNLRYGFEEECEDKLGDKFGPKLFDTFQKAFDQLPFGCLISGKVLTVHGGIGDGTWKLSDLKAVRKPVTSADLNKAKNQWLYNILWSDPIKDDDLERANLVGIHPSPRGEKAANFAWNVSQTFCAANGLSLIIRSHEVMERGRGFGILHDELLIRVFSARDYEGNENDGAILHISKDAESHSGQKDMLNVKAQVLHSACKARNSARTLTADGRKRRATVIPTDQQVRGRRATVIPGQNDAYLPRKGTSKELTPKG